MKKKKFNENDTTLISKTTEISGDLYFSGTLEVEGKIRGNIFAEEGGQGEIRVRESGLVQGEIKAPSIIINGMVEGDVFSSEHLELAAKARVVGNIYYHTIEMVMGSEINGSLYHCAGGIPEPKRLDVKPPESAPEKAAEILD